MMALIGTPARVPKPPAQARGQANGVRSALRTLLPVITRAKPTPEASATC